MSRIENLKGKTFGRLEVVEFAYSDKYRTSIWKCIYRCGNVVYVRSNNLKSGYTRSCGCYNIERSIEVNTTHRMNRTRIYSIWDNMMQRCYNIKNTNYKHYGGRGIKVCERWHVFENFYKDVGDPPSGKHELDRIENNGMYSIDNYRWVTRKEQMRNTRNNVLIEYNGKIKCMAEWAEEVGINYDTLRARIRKYGWSIERALTTPAIGI